MALPCENDLHKEDYCKGGDTCWAKKVKTNLKAKNLSYLKGMTIELLLSKNLGSTGTEY
jgi:hypothetical protein